MASNGDKKDKYSREYTANEPVQSVGPITWVVGTILKPKNANP